jgi:hypothetical protein
LSINLILLLPEKEGVDTRWDEEEVVVVVVERWVSVRPGDPTRFVYLPGTNPSTHPSL